MSVPTSELKSVAKELIEEHLDSFEFCSIYEDEDLMDMLEADQRKLFNLVRSAKLTIHWEDSE